LFLRKSEVIPWIFFFLKKFFSKKITIALKGLEIFCELVYNIYVWALILDLKVLELFKL